MGDADNQAPESSTNDRGTDVLSVTIANIVSNISKRSKELVLADLREILDDRNVAAYADRIFPYLYAAGFLVYTGMEVSIKNIEGVLVSAGFTPERRISEALVGTGVKNNIVYFHALYFLIVMGMEVTRDNMRKVLNTISIKAEDDMLDEMMRMYGDGMLP